MVKQTGELLSEQFRAGLRSIFYFHSAWAAPFVCLSLALLLTQMEARNQTLSNEPLLMYSTHTAFDTSAAEFIYLFMHLFMPFFFIYFLSFWL